jgi:outer membrane protein TolC
MLEVLIIVALGAAELDPPAFYAGNEELRAYIAEAVQHNPEILARHAEWLAALERIPQVTLENPMFSLTSFLQSDQEQFRLELEQEFPWFGTLKTQRAKAAAEARAALARAYTSRNATIAAVKTAYFDLALVTQQAALVESQAQIYDFIDTSTLSRYSLGLARQEDVYRVQVAKAQLEDRHTDLLQVRPAFEANLLQALGRPGVAGEIPAPQPAQLPPPPPPAPIVLARVATANPELTAASEEIGAREFDVALARKTGYPGFSLGIGYGKMKDPPGEDFKRMAIAETAFMMAKEAPMRGVMPVLSDVGWNLAQERLLMKDMDMKDDLMVMLRVSLPIQRGRIGAATREAALMQRAAEHQKSAAALSLAGAARMALYNFEAAQRQYNLYEDILLPQSQRIYENLQTGYGLGETADFADLIESVNNMLEFQLEQAQAARNLHVAAAELERLIGGPWTNNAPESAEPSK